VRKLARLDLAERTDALQVANLDATPAMRSSPSQKEFYVVAKDGTYKSYPLNADYRDNITYYELTDLNDDGRLDLVLLTAGRFYAGRVIMQAADGAFVDEELVRAQVSGPVIPFQPDRLAVDVQPDAAGERTSPRSSRRRRAI